MQQQSLAVCLFCSYACKVVIGTDVSIQQDKHKQYRIYRYFEGTTTFSIGHYDTQHNDIEHNNKYNVTLATMAKC
jgi:hypothetical protein